MKSLVTAVAVVVLAIVAIVLRNWPLVTARVPVDLFVTTVDFAFGMLLFVAMLVVAILWFASIGRVRMRAAIESRDLHRELEAARRRADSAEASRLAELKTYLDREIPQIELKLDQVLEGLAVRVPSAPTSLR